MNHGLLFYIFNSLAFIGWLLIIIFPTFKITKVIVRSGFLSLFFCLSYLVICLVAIASKSPGGFQNLNQLMLLFESKDWVLTGWIHYLAFDLFIGIWILDDSMKHNIKHSSLIPSLVFTFILGPIGLIIYYISKTIKLKKIGLLNEQK